VKAARLGGEEDFFLEIRHDYNINLSMIKMIILNLNPLV